MAVANSTYGTMYYVDDMKEAVAFYKKLGFKPGFESEEWTEFPVGGHNVCLHLRDEDKDQPENGVLIFKVDGIKALYEKLKKDKFEEVEKPHEVHPGHWSMQMKDPSFNDISFYGAP